MSNHTTAIRGRRFRRSRVPQDSFAKRPLAMDAIMSAVTKKIAKEIVREAEASVEDPVMEQELDAA